MSRWPPALAILLFFSSLASAQAPIQGLDHIPIVVRDLDRAAADFSALGFVLKPGRPHANGLRNVHAKFPDGTELELITPRAPVDELSRRYVEWLRQGEGPVSLGLFAPRSAPSSMEGIFFDKRQKSPTDRPEHFAHPNGASTLAAVWLAGSPAEPQLIALSEHPPIARPACAPFATAARVLRLPEGEIMLLPVEAQRIDGRPIVAATVAVANLDPIRRLGVRVVARCDSLWVETHGLWLQFRK